MVYIVEDDIIILPEDYLAPDTYARHPDPDLLNTRIVFLIGQPNNPSSPENTCPSGAEPTWVKFRKKPRTAPFSRGAVDIHVHSVFATCNAILTSELDDQNAPDLDGKVDVPFPGDWGGIVFYEDAKDFYDSYASADNDNSPEPCAFNPQVNPMQCGFVGSFDWVSVLTNSSFLYGGFDLPGIITAIVSSPSIHGTSPRASVIGYSASNGLWASQANLSPPPIVPPYWSMPDWFVLGQWPIPSIFNVARPQVENTLFIGNTNYACLFTHGAAMSNVDGTANNLGSNEFSQNGHDFCNQI